ncbi:hypothetical protein [Corynebacterium bovis]|uniref:hypothetical protein n=1 Tax=Corynebacterium bovis TaxID=36808 RepID=UPI000F655491|nr:hypothetical protein [Corynebacterium bovis]RRO80189.1 hypothetical protein CXF38_07265 [Corynebacterium bovis]RRO82783.1 hypothetical protein CXF36_05095 [Corynebacterium bovis]RRO83596.1 hypothetical protein CXF37_04840 [Corynebacterium bovis]RRO90282.1 hypothetical protein CXF45_06190 [Corynebacterium bovis]
MSKPFTGTPADRHGSGRHSLPGSEPSGRGRHHADPPAGSYAASGAADAAADAPAAQPYAGSYAAADAGAARPAPAAEARTSRFRGAGLVPGVLFIVVAAACYYLNLASFTPATDSMDVRAGKDYYLAQVENLSGAPVSSCTPVDASGADVSDAVGETEDLDGAKVTPSLAERRYVVEKLRFTRDVQGFHMDCDVKGVYITERAPGTLRIMARVAVPAMFLGVVSVVGALAALAKRRSA